MFFVKETFRKGKYKNYFYFQNNLKFELNHLFYIQKEKNEHFLLYKFPFNSWSLAVLLTKSSLIKGNK